MAISTKPKTGGDVLIHRESTQSNMYSSTVTNGTGAAALGEQVAGYPVDDSGTLLLVVNFGNATGLLIHGPIFKGLAGGATSDGAEKYSVVKGNNVVINESALPAADIAGTAIDAAAITALKGAAGLAGFRWVAHPSKIEVQTD